MTESESTQDLSAALAKAQAAMKPAIFNRVNPHFKNKYADLAAVLDAIRAPLADNSLSVTQTTEIRDGGFVLVTKLRHSSGQWIASEYPLPVAATPQQLGSALTYARRYSLSAIACIAADEDDDAEGARKDGQTSSTPKRRAPVAAPSVMTEHDAETGEVTDESPSVADDAAATYIARWGVIIDAATDAKMLHKAWTDDKKARDTIVWPGDGSFGKLRDRVSEAVKFLKGD